MNPISVILECFSFNQLKKNILPAEAIAGLLGALVSGFIFEYYKIGKGHPSLTILLIYSFCAGAAGGIILSVKHQQYAKDELRSDSLYWLRLGALIGAIIGCGHNLRLSHTPFFHILAGLGVLTLTVVITNIIVSLGHEKLSAEWQQRQQTRGD